jgi:hypothetical protein
VEPPSASAAYEFATLASAGIGVRIGIGEGLIATGLLAQPLTYDTRLAALGADQSCACVSHGLRF